MYELDIFGWTGVILKGRLRDPRRQTDREGSEELYFIDIE